jgi:hypothetical protein
MWDILFSATNLIAVVGWGVLILAPRTDTTRRFVLTVPIALLSVIYAVLLVGLSAGWFDPEGASGGPSDLLSNYSVDGIMQLFQSRGGIVVGWTHYLAFDLMVGWWIAGDADARGIPRWSQAGILLATFMAGPLGLAIYLFYRATRPGDEAGVDDAAG